MFMTYRRIQCQSVRSYLWKNKVYHIGVREVQEVKEVRENNWNICVVRKQVHKKILEEDSGAQGERVLELVRSFRGVAVSTVES